MATTTNNKLSFGAGRILREGTPYLQAPRASILVKHALKKTNKKLGNHRGKRLNWTITESPST